MGTKEKRKNDLEVGGAGETTSKRPRSEHVLPITEHQMNSAEAGKQLRALLNGIFKDESTVVAAKTELGGEAVEYLKRAALALDKASNPLRTRDTSIPTMFRSIFSGKSSDRPPLPELQGPLRELVFTHRSSAESKLVHLVGPEELSYEKLEWYGDTCLEMLATRILWNCYSHLDIKKFNHVREQVQTNEVFGRFAMLYDFDKLLKIKNTSTDVRKDKSRQKILGDVWEAYIGAVILADPEEGFQKCEALMQLLWEPYFLDMQLDPLDVGAKQTLNKTVVAKGCKLNYKEDAPIRNEKEKGLSFFTYAVFYTGFSWTDEKLGVGQGTSVYEAQLRAAMDAMRPGKVTEKIAVEKAKHDEARKAAEASLLKTKSEA